MTLDLHSPSGRNWVASLRRFLGTARGPREFCELCSVEVGAEHDHLIERATRRLLCACSPCAMLFAEREAERYRRVPRDVRRLSDFDMPDAQWERLLIPINLAFFYRASPEGRVTAMYPGPAGAIESQLELAAWEELAEGNPVLRQLEPDVEAVLVNRVEGAREYFRVPIDRCYALVGQIRKRWHGISGGEGVREAIAAFFVSLREQAGR